MVKEAYLIVLFITGAKFVGPDVKNNLQTYTLKS